MTEIETLREILSASRRAVFFGGAGMSTESGIPDFRSAGGYTARRCIRSSVLSRWRRTAFSWRIPPSSFTSIGGAAARTTLIRPRTQQ